MDLSMLQNLANFFRFNPEAKPDPETLAYTAANAALFNQGPRVEAGLESLADTASKLWEQPEARADVLGTLGQSYDDALATAFNRREMLRERDPGTALIGDITGTLANPATRYTPVKSALARIAVAGAQTAANQMGEENASIDDIKAAGLLGGGATAAFEAIPLVGKGLKYVRNFAEEAGLGLKGSAMKKSMNKQVSKTALGEGYDAVKNMITKGEGDENLIAQANKIFSNAPDRIEAVSSLANNKIAQLVDNQTAIAEEAANKVISKTGAVVKNAPTFEFGPGSNFSKEIARLSGKSAKGGIPAQSLPEVNAFTETYNSLIAPVADSVNWAKANGAQPASTLTDLLQLRRSISASGLYDEAAGSVKKRAATAAINDINEAIQKNLKNYESAGLIKAGSAEAFEKAGKESKNLITFSSAVRGSRADEDLLARGSDLLRAGIGGGPIAMGLYASGLDPLTATIAGTGLGTPTGMGAIGAGLRKAGDILAPIGEVAGPASRAAIKTQVPFTPEPGQEQAAPTVDAKTILQNLSQPPAAMPTAPARSETTNKILQGLGLQPNSAAPLAPTAGSLPSQPEAAVQGAALSGMQKASVDSKALTPYFAALAQTESSMNPMAKNKNSSAKGLFQFIDDTAKKTGLENAYDIKQQKKAVEKLTLSHAEKFGTDPNMLYAAHYLGQPTLQAWLAGEPLTEKQQNQIIDFTSQALPNFQANMQMVMQPKNDIMQQFMKLYPQEIS